MTPADKEEVNEDTPLLIQNVNHPYTASKVAAELYIQSYNKIYGTEFTILRYGIPYGPRGREGTVITNFVKRALKGQPLTIQGDGSQYRNFIFVEDLARGNLAALKPAAKNRIYNLEGMRPITIREIAETVSRLIGGIKVEYVESRAGDFVGRKASNERAGRELDSVPTTDLEDGIRRYIAWCRALPSL